MIKKTVYACTICGAQSENEDVIRECEASHVRVEGHIVDGSTPTGAAVTGALYQVGCRWPHEIYIAGPDGDRVMYIVNSFLSRREGQL